MSILATYDVQSSRPMRQVHEDLRALPGVAEVLINSGNPFVPRIKIRLDRDPERFPLFVKDQTIGGINLTLVKGNRS